MLILYAGDSPAGGPANYLLGILKSLKAQFVHFPPSARLEPRWLRERYDVVIFSDYSRKNLPARSEDALIGQIVSGTGFLMVGGWGSFSGPFGGWRGSRIEKLLPVRCSASDDRLNFPSGALVLRERKHPALGGLSFDPTFSICGLNRFRPKPGAEIILSARQVSLQGNGRSPAFEGPSYPLLVTHPLKRIAALATDAAPHWCGGFVDWGSGRRRIRVRKDIQIEVGDKYVRFFSSLLTWLGGGKT